MTNGTRGRRRGKPQRDPETARADLLEQHRAARARRDAAALGSDEFSAAAEEIARIEVEINELSEPPPPAA